jgi:hypothetical protein
MKRLHFFLLLLAAAQTACDGDFLPGGPACTADFRYGVSVRVHDAVTGAPAAHGAVGTLRDGTYSETMMEMPAVSPESADTLIGAGERAGTYTITVQKPGYQTFTRRGVIVTEDECHVKGVVVEARLVPAT